MIGDTPAETIGLTAFEGIIMATHERTASHTGRRTRPWLLVILAMSLSTAMTMGSTSPVSAQASAPGPSTSKVPPTPPIAPPPDNTPPAANLPPSPIAAGDPATVAPPAPVPVGRPKAGSELVEQRTATSKTFVGDHPGELRTEVYAAPVHYRDAQGHWAEIKTDLGSVNGGRRHSGANGFDLSVADSSTDASLAQITLDGGHSIAFALEGAAKTTGRTDAKSVTYFEARPSTDVRLTSRADGVKDELVLASPAAPDRFVFPLVLRGLTASIDAGGDVVYRDAAGVERARTPHGFMTDAKVDPASGEAARSTGVTYALVRRGKGVALEVRLDRGWLNDPARAYPVTVDPQVATAAWGDDTYVMSGFHRDASYDSELKVGTYDGGAHIGRSYVHFDTSFLAGATVTHAEMHAAESWSWTCAAWPEAAYRVTQGWNGRTMTDFPGAAVDPNWAGGVWASGGCNNRTAIWDVTGFASYWAAVGETQGSLSLRATDESNSGLWKKYASTETGAPPALHVTYNHAPITPVWVSPANGTHVIGSTTTATATYADADGGSGQIAFGVWNANSQLVWSAWSPSVCTWCATSVSVSGLADGWYFLQTIGYDGLAYSPAWSPPQWFFLDTVPPPPPTILSPAPGAYVASPVTVSARYTEAYTWSGYVLFDIITSSGGQGPAIWSPLTCNGCTATVTLPALAPGSYTLYALSSDGALSGWAPTRTFNVGTAPTAPTGLQAVAGALSALLSWTVPTTTGGPISSYTFTATDTAGGAPILGSCTSCTNSFTMGGLTPGQSYNFTATATNAVGTGPASSSSNIISALLASVLTPTNVAATRGDTTATVTWRAPTVNVPGITGYTVTAYRASDNTQLGTPATSTTASYTWPTHTFRNGTPVYFTVSATTLILASPVSPPSNTVTPAGPPFAPTNATAQRGNAQATVAFGPPPDQPDGTPGNNGDPISGYSVVAFTAAGNTQVGSPLPTSRGPVVFPGLTNGTTYYFKVQANNGVGTGASAITNSVTPAPPPDPPTNVTATAGDGEASVSWTAPASNGSTITSYTVKADPYVSEATVDANSTSATVGGLVNDGTYTFTVVAHSDVGDSAPSGSSNGVSPHAPRPPAGSPGPPRYVVAFPGDRQATVRWSPADPNGSSITRYTVTASSGGAVVTAAGADTQVVVTGLTNGTAYTFSVFATNALGNSSSALSSNLATPEPTPGPIDVVLGDSYSAGTGAPPYNDACDRSSNAYGPQYAQFFARQPAPTLVLLACHGAKTTDMEREQLPLVPANADHVFLTIGGNDLGFSSVVRTCVDPTSDCDLAFPNKENEIAAFRGRLAQVYAEVQRAAPHARVYVLTYPRFLTNTGRVGQCVGDFGIVPTEKDWVNARTTQLDDVIRGAAADAGATAVNEDGAFTGHEVCTPDQWVNGESFGGASFHPETAGYRQEAADLARVVG